MCTEDGYRDGPGGRGSQTGQVSDRMEQSKRKSSDKIERLHVRALYFTTVIFRLYLTSINVTGGEFKRKLSLSEVKLIEYNFKIQRILTRPLRMWVTSNVTVIKTSVTLTLTLAGLPLNKVDASVT